MPKRKARKKTKAKKKKAARKPAARPASVADAAETAAIRAILEKKRLGKPLTAREVSRLRRWEDARAEKARQDALHELPQRELLELLGGLSRKRLNEYEADGLPRNPRSSEKGSSRRITYDLYTVIPWLLERWRASTMAATKQRTERDELVAERIRAERRKNEQAEGLLINRQEVVRVVDAQTLAFREALQDMDERVAIAIGKCKSLAERQDLLGNEHASICDRFASGMGEMV